MKAGLATSLSIAGVLITGGAALALNSSILDTDSATKGAPALATVVGLDAQGGVTPLGDVDASATASGLSANSVVDAINGEPNQLAAPAVLAAGTPVMPETATTTPAVAGPVTAAKNQGASGAIKQTQAGIAATESTVESRPSTSTPVDAPVTVPPIAPPTTSPTPTTSVAPSTEKQFKVGDAATITLIATGSKLLVKDIAIVPGSGYKVTNQTSRDGDDVRITLTSPTRAIEFSARLVNGQIMAAVGSPSSGNLNPPRPPHHDDDDHDDDRREHDEDEEREHHEDEHDDDDD